jgi:hypothetical protein
MMRKFGPKMEVVAGGGGAGEDRIMRSASPDIVRAVITSRMMRWAWHVARKGEMRYAYKILVGNLN